MKKLNTLLCVISLSGAIFFLGLIPAADAQNTQGKWGFGIRAGGSFLTQDINDEIPGVSFVGNPGPIVSGNIIYGVTNSVSAGVNVEWETHQTDIEVLGIEFDIGDATTVSLLPFVELRATYGSFVPYASLGAGINFNSFDVEPVLTPLQIDPDNTFALKVGGGADYFLTPSFALNAELGWKLNSGDVELSVPGFTATGDYNASAFSLLFGLRTYF